MEACWATAVPVSVKRLVVLVLKAPRLEAVWVCAAPAVAVVSVPELEDDEVDVVEVVEALFPNRLVDVEELLLLELLVLLEVELDVDEVVLELEFVLEVLALPTIELCRPRPLRLPRNRGAINAAKRSAWITPAMRTVLWSAPMPTVTVRVAVAPACCTRAFFSVSRYRHAAAPATTNTTRPTQ